MDWDIERIAQTRPRIKQAKKSRPLWPMMKDDSASIHVRRKLVKTYKNVLPRKWILVADVCAKETYSKDDKKMMKKNGYKRKKNNKI